MKQNSNKILSLFFVLLVLVVPSVYAQKPQIPEAMYFGGMKLHLSKGAREIILKDYLSITQNAKYFTTITQRADLYFPIIEKIFKEENMPTDFKFLALQESSLQSDVVSKSNAVGYWQFKKESAQEVGLQVDNDVDERKHIVSSSRGAAKYLKKANVILNNYVYTLLSYYLGRGGVMPYVKDKYRGSNEMDIDEDMNWYVLRFLAHKYAYERAVGIVPHPQLRLALYENAQGQSLKDIAEKTNIDLAELESYNKWLDARKVPNDKAYSVILPYKIEQDISGENVVAADQTATPTKIDEPIPSVNNSTAKSKKENKKTKDDTKASLGFDPLDVPMVVQHNKLKAAKARKSDSFAKIAYAGKISVPDFLAHNELQSFDNIIPGQLYYLQPKRNHAIVDFHTVADGETLWSIAQTYGVRSASIRKKNRMKMKENIKVGQKLYLRKKISNEEKKQEMNKPLFMQKKVEPAIETPPSAYKGSSDATMPIPPPAPIVKSQPAQVEKKVVVHKPVEPDTSEYEIVDVRGAVDYEVEEEVKKGKEELATPSPSEVSANANIQNGVLQKPKSSELNSDVIKNISLKDSIVIHKILAGQTLYSLSKMYNAPVDSIKNWNALKDNNLTLGYDLIVRKFTKTLPTKSKAKAVIYTVQKGDTIYKISREYGVSVSDILEWNNKTTMILTIGENIQIYK